MSEDMSPYCSAHDEWLIMKLCMYVGYHDADNVSNFDGDPVTQLNLKNVLYYYLRCFTDMALRGHSFCGDCYAITHRLQQYGIPRPPEIIIDITNEEIRGHTSQCTVVQLPE